MFKNKSGKIFASIIISLIILSGAGGYAISKNVSSPLKKTDEEVVSKGCVLETEYIYCSCRERFTEQRIARSYEIGLTRDELNKTLIDMKITDFSPKYIKLTKNIHEYCHKHFILQLEEDELVIKNCEKMKDELKIVFSAGRIKSVLTTAMRKRLDNGIVFNSLEYAKSFAQKEIYE